MIIASLVKKQMTTTLENEKSRFIKENQELAEQGVMFNSLRDPSDLTLYQRLGINRYQKKMNKRISISKLVDMQVLFAIIAIMTASIISFF